MEFIKTELEGAYIIKLAAFKDHRGVFARTFCANEFKEHGLATNMVQSNLSISNEKFTLRGMHYQVDGAEEDKLVRCIRGKLVDVIIDIRPNSKTYCKHIKVELSDTNDTMLYVPRGFAHGFMTLENDTHIMYQVSNFYNKEKERGIRWNDPSFNIKWGTDEPIISDKDTSYPDFKK